MKLGDSVTSTPPPPVAGRVTKGDIANCGFILKLGLSELPMRTKYFVEMADASTGNPARPRRGLHDSHKRYVTGSARQGLR